MIAYLIYSSISLAFLLFVYRVFLEKEKRFTFNRLFLLWSLVFSLCIPMIPVGLAPVEIPWSALFASGEKVPTPGYQNLEYLNLDSEVPATAIENNSASISSKTFITIVLFLYVMISALLLIRLINIVHRIQFKIHRNRTRIIRGHKVILLNENTIPHTFFNTVFLNRKQFERGEIPKEVLDHEFTHVRQKHSLDILFVEFLKAIFWFNPLIYLYKNVIALNHEYLADEAVISRGTIIKNYQHMLLKTMERNTILSLASSFNFSLTKRRLQMMTQPKTKVKFLIKLAMLVPLFTGLSLMLGCEPAPNQNSSDIETSNELSIEILENNALLVNENRMTLDELSSHLSEMPESPGLVRMKVSPDAEFGVVTDVQRILQKHDALKINYSSQKGNDSHELTLPPAPPAPKLILPSENMTEEEKNMFDEAGSAYQKSYREYMGLDPNSTDLEEMEAAYKKVWEAAKKFTEVFKKIAGEDVIPPPIKLGPEPERRKSINSNEVQQLKAIMDMTHENWQQKWDSYRNIEPIEANLKELKAAYFIAKEYHKMLGDIQRRYYNAIGEVEPPLPPIPPEPETRIENPETDGTKSYN